MPDTTTPHHLIIWGSRETHSERDQNVKKIPSSRRGNLARSLVVALLLIFFLHHNITHEKTTFWIIQNRFVDFPSFLFRLKFLYSACFHDVIYMYAKAQLSTPYSFFDNVVVVVACRQQRII